MSNAPNTPDDDLRRALRDAVSDVQPHGSFDQIRSRTDKVAPMTRQTNKRWVVATLTAAAAVALVIGGAFLLTRGQDREPGAAGSPSPSTATTGTTGSETPAPDATESRAVPVYFVGSAARGDKLFREFQQQQVCGTDDCLMKAAAVTALSGHPVDADYSSPWPSGSGVDQVSFEGGTLTVDLTGDLHDRPAGMTEAAAKLAVEQLIYSVQAGLGQGRPPVQLLLDGKHTDTILGVPSSEALAAGNPDDVLAPVQVDSPAEGSQVPGTFTVTGRAATFEANVVWELKQGDKVVRHGFTTAEECCTLAPYSFDVTAPPGDYTLVVHDTDESGQDRAVNQDTKDITVQ